MSQRASEPFGEGEGYSGPDLMSVLASNIEVADGLYDAETQCASDGVVDVGSIAAFVGFGRAAAASIGNGQVLEGFFHEAGAEKGEGAIEGPILPGVGQLRTAREFICCKAINGAALEFAPEVVLTWAGSEENGAGGRADDYLAERGGGEADGACGNVGPDHRFQFSST